MKGISDNGRTLIDYFRAFHTFSKANDFSAATRSVYFALLGEFNANFWIEELSISDRVMMELSGAKSTATVHDARNLLKTTGFIDFRKGKNRKAAYRLLDEHIPSTNQSLPEQSANTNQSLSEHQANTERTLSEQSAGVPNTRVREDLKTLDFRQKTLINNNNSACACADGRAFNWNSGKAQNERTLSEQVDAEKVSPVEMDCHDLWEYETGFKLTGSIAYELERLEEKHGRDAFHQALKDAVAGNSKGRVTFNYFKAILEGGEKSGKSKQHPAVADTSGYDFKPVESTISEEEGDRIYAELLRLDAEKRRKRGLA